MALYSQGSAVVQDSRMLKLDAGDQQLTWPVAGKVKPDTFWLSGENVSLNGLAVASGSQATGNLLADRVGHTVTVQTADGKSWQGKLVAVDGGTAYVRDDDRIKRITAASKARISWPVDEQSAANDQTPSVTLFVHADDAGKQKLTALYQTDAPSWQASYTGRFDPETGQLELSAQALVDNSGRDAINANKAWLIAGDISRIADHKPRPLMMAKMSADSAPAPAFRPEAAGDTYRYTLPHGLHVPADTVLSTALIEPFQVKAQRQYRFENSAYSDTGEARRHVQLKLSFENTSDGPLPAGSVRIYDANRTAQLMGETHIGNTPKKGPIKLSLGNAFDLTATHRVVKRGETDEGATRATVKIELFNATNKTRTVTVVEHLPRGAKLADGSPDTTGGTDTIPQWQVEVPADGHATMTYGFTQPKPSS